MLSQLCLPKSTSSIPSTSGGLRALVTQSSQQSISGVSPSTSLQEKQVEGASRWDCVSVSGDKWIHILG